jgi:hypothetical protein
MATRKLSLSSLIRPIHKGIDPLSHFVASQSLAEDAANDQLRWPVAVWHVLACTAFLGEAVVRQRPVHGLDDVDPLAKLLQGRLGLAGDNLAAGLRLGGETVVFQTLCPADHKAAVLADEVKRQLAKRGKAL